MKSLLFQSDSNYQTIKDIIENNLDQTLNMTDDSILVDGIQSFKKLKNNNRIVSFVQMVDHMYSSSSSNEINKIPIILGGAIILEQYPEKAESLSDEEIALLSHFSLCGGLQEYIALFHHDILDGICRITKDNFSRIQYLSVVEDCYNMFYEEITEENTKEIQNKLRQFVQHMNKERFDYLYHNLDCKTLEYANKKGVAV